MEMGWRINLENLIKFQGQSRKAATITAVKPPEVWCFRICRGEILILMRKPKGDGFWINGGFFVLEPSVIDLISKIMYLGTRTTK